MNVGHDLQWVLNEFKFRKAYNYQTSFLCWIPQYIFHVCLFQMNLFLREAVPQEVSSMKMILRVSWGYYIAKRTYIFQLSARFAFIGGGRGKNETAMYSNWWEIYSMFGCVKFYFVSCYKENYEKIYSWVVWTCI